MPDKASCGSPSGIEAVDRESLRPTPMMIFSTNERLSCKRDEEGASTEPTNFEARTSNNDGIDMVEDAKISSRAHEECERRPYVQRIRKSTETGLLEGQTRRQNHPLLKRRLAHPVSAMPSLVKAGPKLPSFQNVKKRKRSPQEDSSALPEAPQTKKPSPSSSSSKQNHAALEDAPKQKPTTKKLKKVLEWKKKMSAQKEERLKTEKKSAYAPASSAPEKAVPGQNWKKLQVCSLFLSLTSCLTLAGPRN